MRKKVRVLKERRRYERKPLVTSIRYYLVALQMGPTEKLEKIYRKGDSLNISERGLGMITDFPLAAGDIVNFEHGITISNDVIMSSIVRWVKRIQRKRYQVGLEFLR